MRWWRFGSGAGPSVPSSADLIEGVVVTNELTGFDAGKARAILWSALEDSVSVAA